MSLLDAAPAGSAADAATGAPATSADDASATPRDKPGSLLPVLRIIPEAAYDNPTWKGVAYFARDSAIYLAALAGLFLFDNIFVVLALWVVMALVISGLFVIGYLLIGGPVGTAAEAAAKSFF